MFKLSRSAVELSLNCQRCFILQYKFRVSLRSLPFTLNSAVDNLCKNEFDYYRNKEEPEPHPLFLENDGVTENLIDVVPFKHKDLDKWRNFRQGISFTDDKMGYTFYGAIDDVWIKKNGDLIISDVKSTSKKEFNWDKTWLEYEYPKAYKRQLEMYQWLFRKNGFSVSNKAYLVYYNGLKDEPMFNEVLKFKPFLVELDCSDNWVEEAILNAKKMMDNDKIPKGSFKCDTCQYLKKRWDVSNRNK